jgi:hypothetical protein
VDLLHSTGRAFIDPDQSMQPDAGTILRNFCIATQVVARTLAATTQIRLAAAMEWH